MISAREALRRITILHRFGVDDLVVAGNAWAGVTPEATVEFGESGGVDADPIAIPLGEVKAFVGKIGDVEVSGEGIIQGARQAPFIAKPPPVLASRVTDLADLESAALKSILGVAAFAGKPSMRHRPKPYTQVVRFADGVAWASDQHRMAWHRTALDGFIIPAPAALAVARSLPAKTTISAGGGVFAWGEGEGSTRITLDLREHPYLDYRKELVDGSVWQTPAPLIDAIASFAPNIVRVTPKAGVVAELTAGDATARVRADLPPDAAPFRLNATYFASLCAWCPPTTATISERVIWWEDGDRGSCLGLVSL